MNDLREQLAELEHTQWAGWMQYLFENSIEVSDGNVVIPSVLVARWKRQMNTSYVDLPENEKESDRAEADKVLLIFPFNNASNSQVQPTGSTIRPSNAK